MAKTYKKNKKLMEGGFPDRFIDNRGKKSRI